MKSISTAKENQPWKRNLNFNEPSLFLLIVKIVSSYWYTNNYEYFFCTFFKPPWILPFVWNRHSNNKIKIADVPKKPSNYNFYATIWLRLFLFQISKNYRNLAVSLKKLTNGDLTWSSVFLKKVRQSIIRRTQIGIGHELSSWFNLLLCVVNI